MIKTKFIFGLFILVFFAQIAQAANGKTAKRKKNTTDTKSENAASCSPGTATTFLEINNVRTILFTSGDMWWYNNNPSYEIPKGSKKHSNFASSIWIGGTDVNEQLRFAGVTYRNEGNDFWPGPLVKSGAEIATVSADVCRRYDKHFVISRKEVREFRAWYEAKTNGESYDPNYSIPLSILDWPAHGPMQDGAYDWNLAPFRDLNGNDEYEPNLGEYPRFAFDDDNLPCGTTQDAMIPRLYGDQAIWWVYNDNGNVHTESSGSAIGMELRGQAFAFTSNDELNNATFYNFEIINRSTYTLKNAYFAVFTDADVGDEMNDLCGCDVGRGLGYMYNDGDDGDGSLKTYGANPPAIGIDFFEGPFMDKSWNNQDRASAYIFDDEGNRTDEIDWTVNPEVWYNGSINGLNFGDGIPNNERWGMRRFIYFTNGGGPIVGDPIDAIDFYNFLNGNWKDNSKMTYGGTGSHSSEIPADFMFPGTSDYTDWGTQGITPTNKNWIDPSAGDKRFVHSAGPFTLMPGAVNYITTGVVWARSYKSGNFASVTLVLRADDKAQKLFENCFETVDGPDAPELDILEADKNFIFNIYNKEGSNNYVDIPEDYEESSPFIVCPDGPGTCNNTFLFEGYIVYQLKDETVSASDITDANLAKVVFQCDISNDVADIINYEWDGELQVTTPVLKVTGENAGIKHSFQLTEDLFASGINKALVNHKKYYYLAIAYAYNNYKTYNQTDPNSLDGQKEPFLVGRNNIKKYTAIPHLLDQNAGGTTLHTYYGEELAVTQVDGYGTGGNVLELEQETIDRIMSGEPWKVDSINYQRNHSPIRIKVSNPLYLLPEDYILKFTDFVTSDGSSDIQFTDNGYFVDANWILLPLSTYGLKTNGIMGYDTIFSSQFISVLNEQQVVFNNEQAGISIEITQNQIPGMNRLENNGFQEASMEQKGGRWLTFISDEDILYNQKLNWIRSGKYKAFEGPSAYDDYYELDQYFDPDEYYEGILNGTWAPLPMVANDYYPNNNVPEGYVEGLAPSGTWSLIGFNGKIWRYGSIDIFITKDKSKWTRCPVIETSNNSYNSEENSLPASNIGNKFKFRLRASPSVDKDGNIDTVNVDINDIDNPNFIGSYGMGWFPGYVIDIETGERLNIMFGEDSHRGDNNGQDMLWNPTSNFANSLFLATNGEQGELLKGGKHYIYIMGKNSGYLEINSQTVAGEYDYGKKIYNSLVEADVAQGNSIDYNIQADGIVKKVLKNATWVSMPMLNSNTTITNPSDPYDFIKGDVKIRIRMNNPYRKRINDYQIYSDANAPNGNFPMYRFSTRGLEADLNQTEVATDALELVNIVPNPYYAYSEYETSPIDHRVKFTNLPNRCTISIYNVGGNLIRRYEKDNNLTYLDWDLKNEYGISISGGVYIIHINTPDLGEKVLKWFGALRPIDLNNF